MLPSFLTKIGRFPVYPYIVSAQQRQNKVYVQTVQHLTDRKLHLLKPEKDSSNTRMEIFQGCFHLATNDVCFMIIISDPGGVGSGLAL